MGAHNSHAQSANLAPASQSSTASMIQPMLRVGPVDDPLEREADRVADAVVSNQALVAGAESAGTAVQRKCEACETDEQDTVRLQREDDGPVVDDEDVRMKAVNPGGDVSAAGSAERAAAAVSVSGAPLSPQTRAYFEPRFRRDLSDVRIHTHQRAQQAAGLMGARAYTLGRDIAFAAGAYVPQSFEGRRLLAHELTHVIQQDRRSAPKVPQFDGFNQTMRLNRRLRYAGGGLASGSFSPDLRTAFRDWAARNLRVFTSLRPHDSIANGLVSGFEQLARQLGGGLTLTANSRYRFRAAVRVSGDSITLSGLSINGLSAPAAASGEGEAREAPVDPRERLTPELRNWHRALMTSFYSFFSDGSEEFRVLFQTRRGAEPDLLSWQRVSIREGRRRRPTAQTPPDSFSRSFASSIELLLGFPGDEPARRQLVVRRNNTTWTTMSVETVPEPTAGGDPDADLVLDRQALYGQILEDWRRQTREAFTETTIMMASIAGREIIFWYAGGAVLGIFGQAFRRLPLLRNLLTRRAAQPIAEAAGELAGRQGDEFIGLWNRYVQSGGRLPSAEMTRLTELAGQVEARLAARSVARTLSRAEMRTFVEGLMLEYPILNQLARAQSLSGPAQRREMLDILHRFFRETGVAHEVVEDGVVQAARGSGNFASLNSSPGFLQIERSAFESAGRLSTEVTHELSSYYAGLTGRIPRLAETFNAMEILELTIQNGGRYAL